MCPSLSHSIIIYLDSLLHDLCQILWILSLTSTIFLYSFNRNNLIPTSNHLQLHYRNFTSLQSISQTVTRIQLSKIWVCNYFTYTQFKTNRLTKQVSISSQCVKEVAQSLKVLQKKTNLSHSHFLKIPSLIYPYTSDCLLLPIHTVSLLVLCITLVMPLRLRLNFTFHVR